MAKEIERKFLVVNDSFLTLAHTVSHIKQAYLSVNPDATVRVRIRDSKAFITVKSRNKGISRDEWEYPIPVIDAEEMISKCAISPILIKDRYCVGPWEIDRFHGALEGLTLAEIELPSEASEIDLPSFIGKEVSGDVRYYNSVLAEASTVPSESGSVDP